MQKAFIGVVILCAFFIQVAGQQQQISQTLRSIRKDVDNLLKYGKLDAACNEVLQKYKSSLPESGSADLSAAAAEALMVANSGFRASSSSATFRSRCNYKLINQFIDSVSKLDGQLKSLPVAKMGPPGKETVQRHDVVIQVLDDSLESPVNAELHIDSLENAGEALRKAADSAGYYYASLPAGRVFQLTVMAPGYKTYTQQLTTASDKDSRTQVIRLKQETGTLKAAIKDPYQQAMLKDHVDMLFRRFTVVFVLVSIVLLALSAINLIYAYNLRKWYRASTNRPEHMETTEIETIQAQENTAENDLLQVDLPVTPNAPTAAEKLLPVAVIAPVPDPAYFLSEILVTAGPRKKSMSDPESDKDLGEDICGFVSDGKELLLWLLDGTSDLHCLKNPEDKREYFSSRLLAQSIANRLRSSFLAKTGKPLDDLILQAIQDVKKSWLSSIEKLPAAEREILKANIENKNIPECATTLLIGQLSIGGDITAYRSGDSKMFLFSNASENGSFFVDTSLSDKNDEANDRVFFRLMLAADGNFEILSNVPKYEVVTERNISTLIAFSDGVGAATESLIKKDFGARPDMVREEIIYQAQGTADDKSICFVEIKT